MAYNTMGKTVMLSILSQESTRKCVIPGILIKKTNTPCHSFGWKFSMRFFTGCAGIKEMAFTGKDDYAQRFVPRDYLETYHSYDPEKEDKYTLLLLRLKVLHKAFQLGSLKGDTLIDIGSGPSIYQFLSACECFREIIATDYADQNREEMQRWLRKEPGAFDWSPVVKYVCELEGDRDKWAQKEEKVRRTIKQVLKCDVTQPNPLAPLSLPPADCVLSLLCLESACKDLPSYRSAMKNIGSLVKPGGHLVLFSVLEDTYYMAGQRRFSFLYLDQKSMEEAVKEAGFDTEWLEATRFSVPGPTYDGKGTCLLVARKGK